jgi:pimeloyl-ACP methyl ester carboxylesterase
LIVGLSAGTYPATYLANRMHARLCSVASADRADLAIWESPATRLVRHRAAKKGFGLADYSAALFGSHPEQNLAGIAPGSLFVVGRYDPFVPAPRLAGLLTAIKRDVPRGQVVQLSAGHFKTLVMSGAYQRALLGLQRARKAWQVRWPFSVSTDRSTHSSSTSS